MRNPTRPQGTERGSTSSSSRSDGGAKRPWTAARQTSPRPPTASLSHPLVSRGAIYVATDSFQNDHDVVVFRPGAPSTSSVSAPSPVRRQPLPYPAPPQSPRTTRPFVTTLDLLNMQHLGVASTGVPMAPFAASSPAIRQCISHQVIKPLHSVLDDCCRSSTYNSNHKLSARSVSSKMLADTLSSSSSSSSVRLEHKIRCDVTMVQDVLLSMTRFLDVPAVGSAGGKKKTPSSPRWSVGDDRSLALSEAFALSRVLAVCSACAHRCLNVYLGIAALTNTSSSSDAVVKEDKVDVEPTCTAVLQSIDQILTTLPAAAAHQAFSLLHGDKREREGNHDPTAHADDEAKWNAYEDDYSRWWTIGLGMLREYHTNHAASEAKQLEVETDAAQVKNNKDKAHDKHSDGAASVAAAPSPLSPSSPPPLLSSSSVSHFHKTSHATVSNSSGSSSRADRISSVHPSSTGQSCMFRIRPRSAAQCNASPTSSSDGNAFFTFTASRASATMPMSNPVVSLKHHMEDFKKRMLHDEVRWRTFVARYHDNDDGGGVTVTTAPSLSATERNRRALRNFFHSRVATLISSAGAKRTSETGSQDDPSHSARQWVEVTYRDTPFPEATVTAMQQALMVRSGSEKQHRADALIEVLSNPIMLRDLQMRWHPDVVQNAWQHACRGARLDASSDLKDTVDEAGRLVLQQCTVIAQCVAQVKQLLVVP